MPRLHQIAVHRLVGRVPHELFPGLVEVAEVGGEVAPLVIDGVHGGQQAFAPAVLSHVEGQPEMKFKKTLICLFVSFRL